MVQLVTDFWFITQGISFLSLFVVLFLSMKLLFFRINVEKNRKFLSDSEILQVDYLNDFKKNYNKNLLIGFLLLFVVFLLMSIFVFHFYYYNRQQQFTFLDVVLFISTIPILIFGAKRWIYIYSVTFKKGYFYFVRFNVMKIYEFNSFDEKEKISRLYFLKIVFGSVTIFTVFISIILITILTRMVLG